MVYRVYCDGVEFGVDYCSLPAARAAKAAFVRSWPRLRYYIRRVNNAITR